MRVIGRIAICRSASFSTAPGTRGVLPNREFSTQLRGTSSYNPARAVYTHPSC